MFIASWTFDVQYGSRQKALATLKEVSSTLANNGWKATRSRVLEGLIGAPESRFVIEHEFKSLADLEASWEELHRRGDAFGNLVERMKGFVVSGSPRWEIYRIVD